MQDSKVNNFKICLHCNAKNDEQMRYCLQCGSALGALTNSKCHSCGNADDLNSAFCVKCGATLRDSQGPKVKGSKAVTFNWSNQADEAKSHIQQERRGRLGLIAGISFGIICGVMVAAGIIHQRVFTAALLRWNWPSHGFSKESGLVIYSKEPFARVSLAKLVGDQIKENEQWLEALSESGTAILPNLAAGNYLLKIENSGKKTMVQLITIADGRITVTGFPKKIQLPVE